MGSINRILRAQPGIIKKAIYKTISFGYRYGKHFKRWLKLYLSSEKESIEELQLLQMVKLRLLLKHAYENVPYYGRIMDERKIKPEDIETIEDLKLLPILTKQDVINNRHGLRATNMKDIRLAILKSSGSTGEPLQFAAEKTIYEEEAAFIERAYRAHGATLYFNKSIWLRRYVPEDNQPIYYHNYEQSRLYLSAYHLKEENLKEYVELINSYKAPLMVSYPSALYIFACLMEDSNLRLNHIKALHTSSEMLLPHWRDKIEKVLGISVKEHYGQIEKVCLFHKCDHSRFYHENIEYGVTEITEQGDVIATGFLNWYMPFIRYQTNDKALPLARQRQCSCESALPLTVTQFMGRADDLIETIDGKKLPGVNFYSLFSKIQGVKMFQIIQNSAMDIIVKIVPDTYYVHTGATKIKILEELHKRIGKEMQIQYLLVDDIERSKTTGKIRCIENRVWKYA